MDKQQEYGVIHEVGDLGLGFAALQEDEQKVVREQQELKNQQNTQQNR